MKFLTIKYFFKLKCWTLGKRCTNLGRNEKENIHWHSKNILELLLYYSYNFQKKFCFFFKNNVRRISQKPPKLLFFFFCYFFYDFQIHFQKKEREGNRLFLFLETYRCTFSREEKVERINDYFPLIFPRLVKNEVRQNITLLFYMMYRKM